MGEAGEYVLNAPPFIPEGLHTDHLIGRQLPCSQGHWARIVPWLHIAHRTHWKVNANLKSDLKLSLWNWCCQIFIVRWVGDGLPSTDNRTRHLAWQWHHLWNACGGWLQSLPTNPLQNKLLPLHQAITPFSPFQLLQQCSPTCGTQGGRIIKNYTLSSQTKNVVLKDLSNANTTEVVISAHSELCDGGLPISKPDGIYEQLLSLIGFYATANHMGLSDTAKNLNPLLGGSSSPMLDTSIKTAPK